jgi:hypothetical protein
MNKGCRSYGMCNLAMQSWKWDVEITKGGAFRILRRVTGIVWLPRATRCNNDKASLNRIRGFKVLITCFRDRIARF